MRIVLYTVVYYLAINYSYSSSLNDKYVDTSLRIMAEALTDSTAYNRLAFLCDKFGPRLSGSPNLENAINWILKEMKKDSLDNIRGERVKVPVWKRGKESLKLLKPLF